MKSTIGIVGSGRVGTAIATLAKKAGYLVINGSRMSVETAGALPASQAVRTCDIVLLTVCRELVDHFCTGSLVAHCSGLLPSSILAQAKQAGCQIASIHPLQSFPDLETAQKRLAGSYWFWEGDEEARDKIERLIGDLSGNPQRISAAMKPLYHAAAVLANNCVVTLLDIALEIAQQAGISAETAKNAFLPLASTAIDSLRGPTPGLTGPISRGDTEIVSKHLKALESSPEIAVVYRVLSQRAIEIAKRNGNIDQMTSENLSRLLSGVTHEGL
jgi:predicted short-subunit dehydrogenase-like oxidoreductase (DUF2520 family)